MLRPAVVHAAPASRAPGRAGCRPGRVQLLQAAADRQQRQPLAPARRGSAAGWSRRAPRRRARPRGAAPGRSGSGARCSGCRSAARRRGPRPGSAAGSESPARAGKTSGTAVGGLGDRAHVLVADGVIGMVADLLAQAGRPIRGLRRGGSWRLRASAFPASRRKAGIAGFGRIESQQGPARLPIRAMEIAIQAPGGLEGPIWSSAGWPVLRAGAARPASPGRRLAARANRSRSPAAGLGSAATAGCGSQRRPVAGRGAADLGLGQWPIRSSCGRPR